MVPRRHKGDSKTFEELTFEEQAKAMNMNALQFRKQLRAHLRRAKKEGRDEGDVLRVRLDLLNHILADFPLQQPSVATVRIKASTQV